MNKIKISPKDYKEYYFSDINLIVITSKAGTFSKTLTQEQTQ